MGRTNFILLAIGLGGVVALMLLMQSAMRAQADRSGAGLAREIRSTLGTRLTSLPKVEGPPEAEGEAAAGRVSVQIRVVAGADPRRLAADAGHVVWRVLRGETAPSEVVVEVLVADRDPRWFVVPPPWRVREPVRALSAPPRAG